MVAGEGFKARIAFLADDDFDKGGDGLPSDAFGNLYIAAKGIHIFDKKGKPLGIIEVPERPTNSTLGPTGSQTLHITARTSLYTVKLNVDGRR